MIFDIVLKQLQVKYEHWLQKQLLQVTCILQSPSTIIYNNNNNVNTYIASSKLVTKRQCNIN